MAASPSSSRLLPDGLKMVGVFFLLLLLLHYFNDNPSIHLSLMQNTGLALNPPTGASMRPWEVGDLEKTLIVSLSVFCGGSSSRGREGGVLPLECPV